MDIINIRNAFKSFTTSSETLNILKNFKMKVQQGTVYSMMGSSGCGKTTLISCLVGLQKFDRGDVKMFGEPLKNSQNHKIGYMPQEMALFDFFTVKEMIWFFGTIYGLTKVKIEERFRHLSTLLELPDDSKSISECSGGEQRRISFAVSLVNDPSLLILDEPTVGVDPLLREKIWNYLIELVKTKNLTIFLSTHYIVDAVQSDRVGFLRDGILIVEDTPQMIMEKCQTTNMDEAFLKLSELQDSQKNILSEIDENFETEISIVYENLKMNDEKLQQSPKFSTIMKALVTKNWIALMRNVGILGAVFILPILGCLALHFGVGGRINGLVLGVVNDEVSSGCFSAKTQWFDCEVVKFSCSYIENFDQNVAKLLDYKKPEDAHQDAKNGKIIGYLYFPPNFTESLSMFHEDDDKYDPSSIQIFLDQTDLQISTLIQNEIYSNFFVFMKKTMRDCGKSENVYSSPLKVLPVYGTIDFDLKKDYGFGFILLCMFQFCIASAINSIIFNHGLAFWDRTIVSGVKAWQILVAHLIETSIIMLIHLIIFTTYQTFFLTEFISCESTLLQMLLLLLTGITSLALGAFFSTIFKSVTSAMLISSSFMTYLTYLSGCLWPTQSMPQWMQLITRFFSFATPIDAMRNVILKEAKINDLNFQQTIWFSFLYSAILLTLAFKIIK